MKTDKNQKKSVLSFNQLKRLVVESSNNADYVKGQLERIRELVDGLITDVDNGEFFSIQDGVYEIEGCIEGIKSEIDNL